LCHQEPDVGAARKDAMLEMLSVARRIRAIMRDQGRDNGHAPAAGQAFARTRVRAGVGPGPALLTAATRKPVPPPKPVPNSPVTKGPSRPATRAQQTIRAGGGEDAPGSWYAQGQGHASGCGSRAASRALCRDNARVVLTAGVLEGRMITSPDPCDRAHLVMDRADRLLPATAVPNATPRQYPASCCTAAGVPFDSMFDGLHEREMRLAGVPGLEYQSRAGINEQALIRAARLVGDDSDALRLRDILRPRTRLGKDRGVGENAGKTKTGGVGSDGRDAHPTRVGRKTSATTGAELNHANDRAATGRDRARA
jgi:hypothetical protein